MRKTVPAIIALSILITVQALFWPTGAAAEEEKSLVIGRIIGTDLGYPNMFRNSDINRPYPDPMVVRGFELLDEAGERVSRIHIKKGGFFFSEVPSGSLVLARFRKDRPSSYEPIYFRIMPFVAVPGTINNLGTIAFHLENDPLETALRIDRWATVGEFLYRYRYIRVDDHDSVLGTLKNRDPELYELYFNEGPEVVNTLPSRDFDSSEKEFIDYED